MKLKESGEMYLETILMLKNKSENVRAIDIVNYTGYSKPSVSRAVGLLKKGNFIRVDSNGYINFTETGEALACKIYNRHTVLTNFFIALGVSEKIAVEDACKIEHTISDETLDAIKKQLKIIQENGYAALSQNSKLSR